MAAPAPPGLVKPIEVPPATAEDLEKFISANARWLDEGSTAELKGMNPQDQRRVIAGGTIVSCRDASGVMRSRVRQAREKEALLANARAGNANPGTGAGQVAVIGQGGVGMLSKPATSDEIEAFIGGNRRWLSEEAEELLRAMTPVDQKRVLAAGTLSGCRDPVAVVQTRAKKAREMEMEFENLTRGGVLSMPKVEVPAVPMPTFSAETGMAYIYAPPQEVNKTESRFSSAPVSKVVIPGSEAPSAASGGDIKGVGGVVEIQKAKYSCSKGQRLRVIGETSALLQLEGGKSVPQNHQGTGWKWVMKDEEQQATAAKQAGEQARKLQMEAALKASQAKAAQEAAEKEKEKEKAAEKEKEKKQKEEEKKAGMDEDALKEKELEKAALKEKEEAEKKKEEEEEREKEKEKAKEKEKEKAKEKEKEKEKEKDKKRKKDSSSSDSSEPREKKSKKDNGKDSKKEDSKKEDSKKGKEKEKDSKKKKRSSSDSSDLRAKKKKPAKKKSDSSDSESSSDRRKKKAREKKKEAAKKRKSSSSSRSRSRDKKGKSRKR